MESIPIHPSPALGSRQSSLVRTLLPFPSKLDDRVSQVHAQGRSKKSCSGWRSSFRSLMFKHTGSEYKLVDTDRVQKRQHILTTDVFRFCLQSVFSIVFVGLQSSSNLHSFSTWSILSLQEPGSNTSKCRFPVFIDLVVAVIHKGSKTLTLSLIFYHHLYPRDCGPHSLSHHAAVTKSIITSSSNGCIEEDEHRRSE
jgi:hypothetical protein